MTAITPKPPVIPPPYEEPEFVSCAGESAYAAAPSYTIYPPSGCRIRFLSASGTARFVFKSRGDDKGMVFVGGSAALDFSFKKDERAEVEVLDQSNIRINYAIERV